MNTETEKPYNEPIRKRGFRPLCPCCEGGDKRAGYSCPKAVSRYQSMKARRSKPKYKNKRK